MLLTYAAKSIARMNGCWLFVINDGTSKSQYRLLFNAAKAEREPGFLAGSYREGLADAIEWFYKADYFK
jgi:hypothetical protein